MAEIAKRYATALFQLAKENDKIDIFFDEAVGVLKVLDIDFLRKISNPDINSNDKMKIFEVGFSDKISNEFLGLFKVVIEKNRQNELRNIFMQFIKLVENEKGIVNVTVFSALELDESQVESIRSTLVGKLNKKINVSMQIDKSLIGGLKIMFDGYVFDNTIKKQLNDIKMSCIG